MGLEFLTVATTRILICAALAGIVLDVVSGLARAVMHKELSSEKMRLGLWHKAGFVGLIILGAYVEWVQGVMDVSSYIGFTLPTLGAICIYIVITEIISITENLIGLNPEIANSPVKEILEHKNDND